LSAFFEGFLGLICFFRELYTDLKKEFDKAAKEREEQFKKDLDEMRRPYISLPDIEKEDICAVSCHVCYFFFFYGFFVFRRK